MTAAQVIFICFPISHLLFRCVVMTWCVHLLKKKLNTPKQMRFWVFTNNLVWFNPAFIHMTFSPILITDKGDSIATLVHTRMLDC